MHLVENNAESNIEFDKEYYLRFGHHTDNIGVVFRHSDLLLNSKHVLIAPCGYGQIVLWCVSHGIDCDGLDVSQFLISIAQKQIKNKLYCESITEMNLPNKYDLIVCCDLLEHLDEEDINMALKKIYDHLYEDGKVIFKIGIDEIKDFDSDPTHKTKKSFWWWNNVIQSFGFSLFNGATEIGEAVYIKKNEFHFFSSPIVIEIESLPREICGLLFSLRIDGKLQINLSKHKYVMTLCASPVYKVLFKKRDFFILDVDNRIISRFQI